MSTPQLRSKRILFFLSGSIAAFKAAQVISTLVQRGYEVQTVTTRGALEFIGRSTLEGLTGRPVFSDLWESSRAMDHIELTRWADLAVLCPASANTISDLAVGRADNSVNTTALAWPKTKKFLIYPSMNPTMLSHPAVTANLNTLKQFGFAVMGTNAGPVACGEVGSGRLLEPTEIIDDIEEYFAPQHTLGEILITGGATREPIDGVRFISNVSTGSTAAAIADELSLLGWQITHLHGEGALTPLRAKQRIQFSNTADLNTQLKSQLSTRSFAAVIHCAAVSDYRVAEPKPEQKLKTSDTLSLDLVANPKLLPLIRAMAHVKLKSPCVVGFKLTLNVSREEQTQMAQALLGPSVDFVVANDWAQVQADRKNHATTVFSAHKPPIQFTQLKSLVGFLSDEFLKRNQVHLVEGELHGPNP